MTFTRPPTEKLIISKHAPPPLQAIRLLRETFSGIINSRKNMSVREVSTSNLILDEMLSELNPNY